MRRWQRRAHLVIWLLVAVIVCVATMRLIEAQPKLDYLADER